MPVLLRLAYDGTDLRGCPRVDGQRTVVGELGQALTRVGVIGSVEALSRTDAGVHATGQVAVLVSDRQWPAWPWLRAFDRHLPPDLRCTGVALVDAVPRVLGKTYTYTLDVSRFGDPFLARRAWRVDASLDALAPLAHLMEGSRDFGAFRRRGETREHLRRTILAASWEQVGHELVFTISGDGFTYRLVRSLVGGMVAVAVGGCTHDDLAAALEGHVTRAAVQQAPARGLCLRHIALDPEPTWVSGA